MAPSIKQPTTLESEPIVDDDEADDLISETINKLEELQSHIVDSDKEEIESALDIIDANMRRLRDFLVEETDK